MDGWEQVVKCKECGAFPFVFKIGRRRQMMCDHGVIGAKEPHYDTTAAWNAAQQPTKPTAPEGEGA